jgi:hypothetical protein
MTTVRRSLAIPAAVVLILLVTACGSARREADSQPLTVGQSADYSSSGRIRERDSYGNDPYPPEDKD